ncbi:hypothetical protein IAQ61_011270 [Plenodomus lingam]|uniref:uncharacterized protein n=1 Tax=Leptosphaeria maculans TaxID=5022 RepID=UPI003317FD37|nr:hypothetical protein IAQ61_011270 [Plenodomus lingam]
MVPSWPVTGTGWWRTQGESTRWDNCANVVAQNALHDMRCVPASEKSAAECRVPAWNLAGFGRRGDGDGFGRLMLRESRWSGRDKVWYV